MSATRKIWATLFICSLIIFNGEAYPKRVSAKQRVCVIGAGRAGLAAIKLLADHVDDFEIVAFERNSDVGGLWIYTDKTGLDEHGLPVHSSIYKNLRTNLPKDILVYPDYSDFQSPDAFVSHEVFLEYMKNYTDHFHLRKYIKFDTFVKKVTPIEGNSDDWRTTKWRMETRNFNANKDETTICDAVMVCNGHFSKPNIPKIPGIETFPGKILHSRSYRRPEHYTNQTVVLLGGGTSGVDISQDLSSYAKTVYLSHRHYAIIDPRESRENVIRVSGVVAANGTRLILQDNSTITGDTFIYCTGYLYDFPFLDESSGIVVNGKQMRPVYLTSINVKHPTMAFIGMINDIVFGSLYYFQANNFIEILQGKMQLPSYEEMLEESEIAA